MSKDKVEQEELIDNVNASEGENGKDAAEAVVEEIVEKTDAEKLADINDKYLRLYSDFDNFRKRTIKERIS